MIINRPGAEFLYGGVIYRIGDHVIGNSESEYAGLLGSILEIRDGEDKETENETPDIYCSFNTPVLPADVAALEALFSDLYNEKKTLEDIVLDMVIMAPEMLAVPGSPEKTIKVYVLKEDWTVEGNQGSSIRVYADILEAKARLNESLSDEMDSGCISDWIGSNDYMTETTDLSYEGWMDSRYSEDHYAIFIEEQEMNLTSTAIGEIGRSYLDSVRYEDLASQVAEWEEVGRLSEKTYQKCLADKRIPEMIDKNLGETYWECYWEAVSEVAHTLLRDYLGQNTHPKMKSVENKEYGR